MVSSELCRYTLLYFYFIYFLFDGRWWNSEMADENDYLLYIYHHGWNQDNQQRMGTADNRVYEKCGLWEIIVQNVTDFPSFPLRSGQPQLLWHCCEQILDQYCVIEVITTSPGYCPRLGHIPELLEAETHGEMQLPESCFMSSYHLSPPSFALWIIDGQSSIKYCFLICSVCMFFFYIVVNHLQKMSPLETRSLYER